MNKSTFFKRLNEHWKKNLPFVIYQKPKSNVLKALIQQTNDVCHIDKFTDQSGFIFAPFESTEKNILIPFKHSESLNLDKPIERSADQRTDSNPLQIKELSQSLSTSKQKHISLIQKAIDSIKTGKLTKVIVSRREEYPIEKSNPINLFKLLNNAYPHAFTYCWSHPNVGTWLGASPETLVKLSHNRLETVSLAGTLPYNKGKTVIWGDKEYREQEIVTRDIKKILAQYFGEEPIKTTSPKTTYAGPIAHLKTHISVEVEPKKVPFDSLVNALHPSSAVCGFPRREAKRFIEKYEKYDRAFYTGFLGEIEVHNSEQYVKYADLYVNLRCMQLEESMAYLFVGGGITDQSAPNNEWQETAEKALTLKQILDGTPKDQKRAFALSKHSGCFHFFVYYPKLSQHSIDYFCQLHEAPTKLIGSNSHSAV